MVVLSVTTKEGNHEVKKMLAAGGHHKNHLGPSTPDANKQSRKKSSHLCKLSSEPR
jgi:hypothetical protein